MYIYNMYIYIWFYIDGKTHNGSLHIFKMSNCDGLQWLDAISEALKNYHDWGWLESHPSKWEVIGHDIHKNGDGLGMVQMT